MSRFERVTLPLSSTFGFFDSPDEASAENVTALDLDGDGALELAFHLWDNAFGSVDTDAFVPNRLAILDAGREGWSQVTSEVVQSTPFAPNSLGGATRQNRIADLNGDGLADIAWSVNQEDGRSGASDFDALTSILLSGSDDTYEVVAPGDESWFHAIGARGYDASHAQQEGVVVASGYGNLPQAFVIDDENGIRAETLPSFGASTLMHLDRSAPDDDNIYFFTDSGEHPAILQRTPTETWSITDEAPITEGLEMRIFRDVPAWNGDITPERIAYRFQDEWIAGLAPNDAAEIDLTGTGDHVIVAHVAGARLEETGDTVVESASQYLMFFEFADGALNRLDVPIDGYNSDTNRNFIDVIDVDGDGLDDIVSYDYLRSEGAPLFNVYRNTGENRFEKLDLDAALPEPLATTGSSLIRDFNGDGRLDILEWASDGGVDDPDSPSAVIHYAMQDWISPGGRPSVGDERDNAEYFRTVQEAYIAYYDRPADAGGLAYWSDRLDQNNGDLDSIIDAFANSPEALDRYGSIDSEAIVEVIRLVYQGIFDRAPDRSGLEFYTEGYARGDFSPGSMALDIAAGAVGKDELLLENRISMGILEAFG
jgi:hypothetical protein